MKIELKNVKHAEFASEETHCFEATLYIDGKRACKVWNDGRGGPDEFSDWDVAKRINEYAKTLPPIDMSDLTGKPGDTMEQDAEIIIGELMNEWLKLRDLKRMCAKKTCGRVPGETYADGEYSVWKVKYTPAFGIQLKSKFPGITILNEELAQNA